MTSPPTEIFTVSQIGSMLRRSTPPFEWFKQAFVLAEIITSQTWAPCYIKVGISNDDPEGRKLFVSVLIQQTENSPVELEDLLRNCKVVLWRNSEDKEPVGNLVSEGLADGTFAANFDLPLAYLTPASYLTLA